MHAHWYVTTREICIKLCVMRYVLVSILTHKLTQCLYSPLRKIKPVEQKPTNYSSFHDQFPNAVGHAVLLF